MEQNYLMVNTNTNIVENICVWDGSTDTWQPPVDVLMLVQAITPAMVWVINADQTDYVLTEVVGIGQVGYTWDGTVCTTNDPKPPAPIEVES